MEILDVLAYHQPPLLAQAYVLVNLIQDVVLLQFAVMLMVQLHVEKAPVVVTPNVQHVKAAEKIMALDHIIVDSL